MDQFHYNQYYVNINSQDFIANTKSSRIQNLSVNLFRDLTDTSKP